MRSRRRMGSPPRYDRTDYPDTNTHYSSFRAHSILPAASIPSGLAHANTDPGRTHTNSHSCGYSHANTNGSTSQLLNRSTFPLTSHHPVGQRSGARPEFARDRAGVSRRSHRGLAGPTDSDAGAAAPRADHRSRAMTLSISIAFDPFDWPLVFYALVKRHKEDAD